jgi:DNA-binding transcriptional regulator YiaG
MTPAAEQLRAAREAARLTWPEVARLTGVPLNTLRRWSEGAQTPRPYTLQAALDKLAAHQEKQP